MLTQTLTYKFTTNATFEEKTREITKAPKGFQWQILEVKVSYPYVSGYVLWDIHTGKGASALLDHTTKGLIYRDGWKGNGAEPISFGNIIHIREMLGAFPQYLSISINTGTDLTSYPVSFAVKLRLRRASRQDRFINERYST